MISFDGCQVTYCKGYCTVGSLRVDREDREDLDHWWVCYAAIAGTLDHQSCCRICCMYFIWLDWPCIHVCYVPWGCIYCTYAVRIGTCSTAYTSRSLNFFCYLKGMVTEYDLADKSKDVIRLKQCYVQRRECLVPKCRSQRSRSAKIVAGKENKVKVQATRSPIEDGLHVRAGVTVKHIHAVLVPPWVG